MHFIQVGQLARNGLVAKRDIDHAVVSKRAHGGDAGRLLTSTEGSGGDEKASVLAPEATLLPLAAGAIEECLPLGREIAVASGDPEENTVVLCKLLGSNAGNGRILGWGVHLLEDFLGKGFLNPVKLLSQRP